MESGGVIRTHHWCRCWARLHYRSRRVDGSLAGGSKGHRWAESRIQHPVSHLPVCSFFNGSHYEEFHLDWSFEIKELDVQWKHNVIFTFLFLNSHVVSLNYFCQVCRPRGAVFVCDCDAVSDTCLYFDLFACW